MLIRSAEIIVNLWEIVERFVGFIPVSETTGFVLTEVYLEKFKQLDLPISDCRGQAYDNGSNMRDCHKAGVLTINRRALNVSCGCHNLNLILCDMAKSLFDVIKQIYYVFSALTQSWNLVMVHEKHLTVKELPETRWECRVESDRELWFQIVDIYEALIEVSETTTDFK